MLIPRAKALGYSVKPFHGYCKSLDSFRAKPKETETRKSLLI
jgi:hypothetical protein